jgi:acetyl esterase/lipase
MRLSKQTDQESVPLTLVLLLRLSRLNGSTNMSTYMERLSSTMAYIVKLLLAKGMRSIVSLVVKYKAPPQLAAPKPAITIQLEKIVDAASQQKRHKRPRLIRVDVYLPSHIDDSNSTLPVIVNMHGSGFLLNTFGDDARFCQLMANQVSCAVFDVAYSKAPEYPFPNANEDAESVIEWIKEKKEIDKKLEGKGVKVQSDRVALTGFSSGGNLVLTSCIRAKEKNNLEMIKAVVAFYPS